MLDDQQLEQFREDGYLVVDEVLDPETVLDPVIEEYEQLLSQLGARWISEGRLAPDAPAATFQDRIISAYRAGLDYFQPMDISLPGGEISPDTPFHAGPAIFRLMTDDNLLDTVEAIIGPENTSNPIQHVRIKPPVMDLDTSEIRAHITATDWHQDRAVTLEEADRTRMVTVWLAVTDATVENGCLQVIPGSHRGEMMPHCPNPQVGIPESFIDGTRARPLPVKSGGAILFHPLTIHGSLVNTTSKVRWSFDLRYNVTGDPTGRPMFPGFVARSRAAPETELRDPAEWRGMWEAARSRLSADPSVTLHRWAPDAAHCA
jgi:ectoine hydroxylase-related dioxygenase (phytanoyl-CoA dioxygenase family)